MTFHSISKRQPKGARTTTKTGGTTSPRIAVATTEDDMRRLTWLAAKRGVPVAAVIRDAVWAYLLPIAADADRETKKEKAGDCR